MEGRAGWVRGTLAQILHLRADSTRERCSWTEISRRFKVRLAVNLRYELCCASVLSWLFS